MYGVEIEYFGDFVDIFVSFRDEFFCIFYFEEDAIVDYGDVHCLSENRTKIGSAVSYLCGDILEGKFLRQVIFHVRNGGLYDRFFRMQGRLRKFFG